tara:strand:+ start:296 stop:493 length:198 start_codon:yes stop_codon:yes gene_type:complete
MKKFQITVTATVSFDIEAKNYDAAKWMANAMVEDGVPIWSDYDGDMPTTDPEFSFNDDPVEVNEV